DVDGAGMCVDTSVEMAALYQGLEQMRGFRDWAAREPGGGDPDKLADQIKRFCRAKGVPVPRYVQYDGPDCEKLLEMADKTGRIACTTYGQCPRYVNRWNPRGVIYHMVCSTRHRRDFGVVMDNNKVGGVDETHLHEWMTTEEHLRRIKFH